MKPIYTMIMAVICIFILIAGNFYWNNKTAVTVEGGEMKDAVAEASEKPIKKKADKEKKEESNVDVEKVKALAANWPENARNGLVASLDEGRPYHIVFAGSPALGEGEDSWPELVKKGMTETYGNSVFTFTTLIFDTNSNEFVEEGHIDDLAETGADLILLEPFTLKDNGVVEIEKSAENIEAIIAAVKEENEDTVVLLQPPHPISSSSWYPVQVEELGKFANANGYTFLNHWEAWPEDTTGYLTESNDGPNEKGHEIWAKYLLEFFINKTER